MAEDILNSNNMAEDTPSSSMVAVIPSRAVILNKVDTRREDMVVVISSSRSMATEVVRDMVLLLVLMVVATSNSSVLAAWAVAVWEWVVVWLWVLVLVCLVVRCLLMSLMRASRRLTKKVTVSYNLLVDVNE